MRTEEEIQMIKNKYPNFPEAYIPRTKTKSKNPTNQFQRDIIQYVRLRGGYAFRVNTMGTYSEKLGKYIKNGSTTGTSDVIICFQGMLLCCEVKRGKDKQRPEQVKFMEQIRQAGGKYFIASDMDSFKIQFHSLINE